MQMTPNNWDRAKELFEAALELDPSQRATFLAANCHQASLQQQVERWLIDYQAAGSFLDKPALHSADETAEIEDPMINRRLGAYKLVRRLAQGGMAAVFLAVRADDEYHKEVAVKLVRPGLDSQDLMNRFRNERQTLAGLDHPNIVRLLDGGSTPEGAPFLVMEYVEGRPIDEYCDQHKLSVDDRLHLFGEVCDAVQYAHEKLVIHRDLKPSNILVMADGAPKLLDFGIAKVLNPEPSNQGWLATQTGLRCMTPAYASPEQARGKSVTTQTDVYSLGVVLYELLTGHRPYRLTQHSPAEIERAICEQEPEIPSTAISRIENDTSPDGKPITKTPELVSLTREGEPDKLRRRLRGDLDNIVLKSLQKEPQYRYGSVAEFSKDIDRHLQHQPVKARPSTFAYRVSKFVQRHKAAVSAAVAVLIVIAALASFAFNSGIRGRLGRGSTQTSIQSLAVIPLVNISGDSAQEYLSDGLTDALIGDLAEIGSLKVISRTTSMQYKDTKKSLPEIARELNVDGIVEGTVQRSGDRVRISAQLIYAASDRHLWAKSYERDVRDVFALEREVTEDIARQVQAKLTTPNQQAVAQLRPVDPKALDAYLQGNYHLNQFGNGTGDEEKRKAAEYFQQAIDADPQFASAYHGLAKAHLGLLWPSRQDFQIASQAAERAFELDPNSSKVLLTLGGIKETAWDWAGAEEEYRRAVALNPKSADAHGNLGNILDLTGRLDEGWKEQQIAFELDPNNIDLFNYTLSCGLELRGQYDQAIAIYQMFLKREPGNGFTHIGLARDYLRMGMDKEAMPHLEQAWILFGLSDVAAEMRRGLATAGYHGAILESAKAFEHLIATQHAYLPVTTAELYAAVGDKERAFYWLEQSYSHREFDAASSDDPLGDISEDPPLEPLRSDPRFKDLLHRMGLPELQINESRASGQLNGNN
jgi:eukaryotic-like serine/threonine-protein kinase